MTDQRARIRKLEPTAPEFTARADTDLERLRDSIRARGPVASTGRVVVVPFDPTLSTHLADPAIPPVTGAARGAHRRGSGRRSIGDIQVRDRLGSMKKRHERDLHRPDQHISTID